MRVVIAPDSFGATLSAPEAADAIIEGIQAAQQDAGPTREQVQPIAVPMSDGGPGFVAALARGLGSSARVIAAATTGPHGEPVDGQVLLDGHGQAFVESAQAAGLTATTRRDPAWATSFGVGTLMRAAAEAGARTITVGLGGSATNDGGAGLLAALGLLAEDEAGGVLPHGALPLLTVARISGTPALRTSAVVAATDVDNPLCGPDGASAVFGPQKGASVDDVPVLDEALRRWAVVLQRDMPVSVDLLNATGSGAAGGMGAALLALRATRRSGFEIVAEAVGLDGLVASADLVVTGEGSFDEQSLRGKVTAGVAAMAQRYGVPCVVLAGRSTLGSDESAALGVREVHTLVEAVGQQRAMDDAYAVLRGVAQRIARGWVD